MNEDQIRAIIRDEMSFFLKHKKLTLPYPTQILDGNDITVGQTIGTRIGTSATQKIAFFGQTPSAQLPRGVLSAATGGATIDNEARARIADLNTAFNTFGLAVYP